jgi:hypothetical protein
MKFKVFFQATGVVVVNAKSQAEAEDKAENLADDQITEAIGNVEILDVVKAGEKSAPAAD